MPTECSADLFGFGTVEGRDVVAAFDGGMITSDAGALLLGATDRAIGMMARFAGCFGDTRRQEYVEHEVVTLVAQREVPGVFFAQDVQKNLEAFRIGRRHDQIDASSVPSG